MGKEKKYLGPAVEQEEYSEVDENASPFKYSPRNINKYMNFDLDQ